MLEAPDLISFDLDDTLWECQPVIRQAEQRLYDWLKRHYPKITARFSQMAMRDIRTARMREHPELRHDLTRLRVETLRWHARLAGYPASLAEAGFEVFIEARNQVKLYDEVLPVLERLSSRYRLVALTNGNACVRRIGIGHFFIDAVNAADAGACKPAPDMFDLVRSRSGVDAARMLHIGDDPATDILGAHNAGVVSVWLNRSGRCWDTDVARAHHEITRLDELFELLPMGAD